MSQLEGTPETTYLLLFQSVQFPALKDLFIQLQSPSNVGLEAAEMLGQRLFSANLSSQLAIYLKVCFETAQQDQTRSSVGLKKLPFKLPPDLFFGSAEEIRLVRR